MFQARTARSILALAWSLTATAAFALDPDLEFYQYDFEYPAEAIELPTEIFDVVQDRGGFLWLATVRGLARYDGIEFVLYRVSEYPELLFNKPRRLFIDSMNRLYIASRRGLSLFDGERFSVLATGRKWAAQIHAITEDSDGTIWLGSDEGLWQFDGNEVSQSPIGRSIDQIRSLLWHGGKLYVGARGRVHILDGAGALTIDLPAGYSRARVRDLGFHQGHIWGATRSGLIRLEGDVAHAVDEDVLAGLPLDILLSDRDENLWFASPRVLGRIYPDGSIELPDVESEAFGFVPEITALFEDVAGQQWQTSRFFGLTMLRNTAIRRISYTEGLLSPNVTALTSDTAGTIFAATDKGVSSIDGETIDNFITDDFSAGGSIQSLLVDGNRDLWLGTEKGLRVYNLEDGEWSQTPGGGDADLGVNALANGANRDIWVATDVGLHNYSGGQLTAYAETAGLAIESLLLDSRGTLWLGTENGIGSIVDGKFERHAVELPEGKGTVVSIAELPSGDIVAATADFGVLVRHGDRWINFGERDGLPHEPLIDIESKGQELWLVTGAGVFRAALPDLEHREAPTLDVQPVVAAGRYRSTHSTNCCRGNNGAAATLTHGSLIAASDDGVIIFDADIPTNAGPLPRPYIKTVSHSGTTRDVFGDAEPAIQLESNSLQIDYSAVQLARGNLVEFRYRLQGLSDDWIDVGRSRSAQFQSLPPGDYVFELQASSNHAVWSEETATLAFTRPPVFAETAGYRMLIWTASIAAGLLVIWLRLATTRRRHRRLEKEIEERTMQLSDLNSELQSANRELQHSNQTDPLTGLINRRFFDAAQRQGQLAENVIEKGLLMMIDIDYFKRVNDSYGHPAGDEVLCQFANVLRSVTRQGDLVARWGGEEFMLVCYCPNDDAEAMLDRICSAVRGHRFKLPDGRRIQLSASIGCIRYPLWTEHSMDDRLPVLLELADGALYSVKMNGRDGWVLLEGRQNPDIDLKKRGIGQKLKQLVDDGNLRWRASRIEIGPALDDTVTRLRAIKIAH